MKVEISHRDRLDRKINLGDCVAFSFSSHLCIGIIDKLNPKMVRIKELGRKSNWTGSYNRYPQDVVLLQGPEVSIYLLKHSSG